MTLRNRLPSEDLGSGSPTGSQRFEDFPPLPSSPSSLLGSGWSYPGSPEASEGSGQPPRYASLSIPHVLFEAPNDLSSDALVSAFSPQEQHIPFQYADSIFEEKLLEDEPDADAAWDGVNDQSTSDQRFFTGNGCQIVRYCSSLFHT